MNIKTLSKSDFQPTATDFTMFFTQRNFHKNIFNLMENTSVGGKRRVILCKLFTDRYTQRSPRRRENYANMASVAAKRAIIQTRSLAWPPSPYAGATDPGGGAGLQRTNRDTNVEKRSLFRTEVPLSQNCCPVFLPSAPSQHHRTQSEQ